ncbi:MAG: lipopolysaccharide biosynthesis protein [Candidatus Bacteroides intestinipullorum]|uniref:Lipopolysaccharide biosynthesis protein n=1 Tax=Candidatus Bacteroides intestinipullorum TaxID=2838471 RepID=A0A9E2KEF0_9BACE|nr:lipopolysaccharide biosynthesis protein [Candidatus Bacteroides intestinipullorum]
MILTMMVSLYTSRVVLATLGVEDFGIYNVVGGIVVMFSFLNTAMSVATQRFLAYEIGRGDALQLNKVFSSSILIHIIIAVAILLVAESVGLWFLNTQLSISVDRMEAANWVYQFSVFAFVINVISVPYNALIISNEEMGVYAYISILEVVLKLLIVFLLNCFGYDKLKLYAFLVFTVALLIRLVYQLYCMRKFPNCKFKFVLEKNILKNLTTFSGWSLFGSVAYIAKAQGVNVMLNIFFGALINAAWGISQQVNAAVLMFVQNISTAINPPIIKAYAQGDKQRMFLLLFNGMKYTFFLAFCLIVPMLFETHFVLSLWLEEVPKYTVAFVQYALLIIGIELFSHITATTIQATGKIKWYQIIVGSILFLNLPISYVVMRLTNSPMSPMYVAVALSIVSMIFRFWLLYRLIHFPLSQLFILFRLTMILLIFSLPSIYFIQSELCEGISRFFIILFSTLFFSVSVLILFGISKEEHLKIRSYTSDKIKIYAKRFKQRY